MSNLYYRIRLVPEGKGYRDFRLLSKHSFPSPVGTELFISFGENDCELFQVVVGFHRDDYQFSNFYMWLDDGLGDPMNLTHGRVDEVIEALLKQGWEEDFMAN